MRSAILKKSEETKHFYENICHRLKDILDASTEIYLFGYNEATANLEVVMMPNHRSIKSHLFVGRGPAGRAFKSKRVTYWHKSSTEFYTEQVIENLNPDAVICLPLTYPRILPDEWGKINRYGKQGFCPAFGVLSLVAEYPHSKLYEIMNLKDKELRKFIDERAKQEREIKWIAKERLEEIYNKFDILLVDMSIASLYNIISDELKKAFKL